MLFSPALHTDYRLHRESAPQVDDGARLLELACLSGLEIPTQAEQKLSELEKATVGTRPFRH